ncbi:hypothetical protein EDD21DRAFT_197588 [Dissophora ornata]|nr:hypothetical protein EDD21DRAFT_197588 [Dissophora ornata]
MPSPIPTTSQSTAHATAQPHSFVSPVSLPERFQHFHLFGNSGSNLGPSRADLLERPHSVCSNASSIEELDEGEDQSGSGSSVQNNTSYVGRRRIFRPTTGSYNNSQSAGYAAARRPLSAGSFPSSSSRRNYSDDHLDQGNGLYGRTVLGRASFNGTASARVVHSNHSSLSKSWVYSPPTESESGNGGDSGQQQQQRAEQQKSSGSSSGGGSGGVPQQRLSPSSTLVSDNIQEQAEHDFLDRSQESLTKSPPVPDTAMTTQGLATAQEL